MLAMAGFAMGHVCIISCHGLESDPITIDNVFTVHVTTALIFTNNISSNKSCPHIYVSLVPMSDDDDAH